MIVGQTLEVVQLFEGLSFLAFSQRLEESLAPIFVATLVLKMMSGLGRLPYDSPTICCFFTMRFVTTSFTADSTKLLVIVSQ